MLSGTMRIASKTMAKMGTLQAVAPIPAFMAWSMLWLRRRKGIGFAVWVRSELRLLKPRKTQN